jgi:hypothetical protein
VESGWRMQINGTEPYHVVKVSLGSVQAFGLGEQNVFFVYLSMFVKNFCQAVQTTNIELQS